MGPRIIGVIFFVFIIGVGLYFARLKPIQKLGLDTIQPSHIFSGSSSSGGGSAEYAPPNVENQPATSTEASQPIYPGDIPEGFTASQLSPWFRKVRISSVYPGFSESQEQTSLYASVGEKERVNVSWWTLRGNRGGQIIPQAVDVYDPSGLAGESDIYLANGDVLYLYSGRSAIGKNLHLNKCLGYLETTNHFNPPLPQNCPNDFRSEVQNFSGQCQDFVNSIGSCQLPDTDPIEVPQYDYGCRQFLRTVNYRGCYERSRADSDFFDHEWRAWTGTKSFDERHDRVFLLDSQGLLVDEYRY